METDRHPDPGDAEGSQRPVAIRTSDLIKSVSMPYGTQEILLGISLTVSTGEFVAIMGPSGSGKSTLLRLMGGLDRATSGDIEVCGQALGSLSNAQLAHLRLKKIGYVFQEFNLLTNLTALENVAAPLEIGGMAHRKATDEARQALGAVGLKALSGRFPSEMSGGEQQRVAIARALIGGKEIVLADEPTGSLDSETAANVLTYLASAEATVVVVTHDFDVARRADRIVSVVDGRIEHIEGASSPRFTADEHGVRPS